MVFLMMSDLTLVFIHCNDSTACVKSLGRPPRRARIFVQADLSVPPLPCPIGSVRPVSGERTGKEVGSQRGKVWLRAVESCVSKCFACFLAALQPVREWIWSSVCAPHTLQPGSEFLPRIVLMWCGVRSELPLAR